MVDGERRPGRGERARQHERGDGPEGRGDDQDLPVPALRAEAADASGAAPEHECGAPGGAAKSREEIAGPREEHADGMGDVVTRPHIEVCARPSEHAPCRRDEAEGPASTDTRGKASADAARDREDCEENSTAHRQQGCTEREEPGRELDRG